MKKRSSVLALLLLLLVALLVWWFWPRASHAPEPPTAKAAKPIVPQAPPQQTEREKKQLELVRELADKSNKPIRFYGLVLDQNDNPVPDVQVTFSIRTTREPTPGMIRDEFIYPTVISDGGGRFVLTDAKGALLSVKSLEKAGYEASEKSVNRAHYWYWSDPRAVFIPDAEKPEVFRMWKKSGAERLVRKGISSSLRFDAMPVMFDLINGSAGADGDLRVALVRNPREIKYGQRNYEWTLIVESPNGGLIESSNEQMYRAPGEGYQPRFVFHMAANDPDWADEKSFDLYLKLRGGAMYGRAEIKVLVGSDRATTPFYVTAFVNPSGSRNLEYDSAQDVIKETSRIKQ